MQPAQSTKIPPGSVSNLIGGNSLVRRLFFILQIVANGNCGAVRFELLFPSRGLANARKRWC